MHDHHQADFKTLAQFLKTKTENAKVFFLANSGNFGDALIRLSTLHFFRDFKIKVSEFREVRKLKVASLFYWRKKRILIYGGGGAWCKLWDHSNLVQSLVPYFDEIIVLPSTFEKRFDIPKTIFFSRDRFESMVHQPQSRFCHDMAFYRSLDEGEAGRGVGYFFRTDRESSNRFNLPVSNRDVSTEGNHLSPEGPFLNAIAQFEEVHTDRLHVAIAATLMKRKVLLYPGSYFKNRAVYLTSMKGCFSNITLIE